MTFNKRANVFTDSLSTIVIMVIIAITAIVGLQFYTDLNDDIQANDDLSNVSKELSQSSFDKYASTMDAMFLTVFIMFWIFAVVSSFFIDSHPIFFIIIIFLMFFIVFIAAVLSNSYQDLASEDELVVYAQEFTFTNHIMNNVVLYIIAIAASIMLVLYGKNTQG